MKTLFTVILIFMSTVCWSKGVGKYVVGGAVGYAIGSSNGSKGATFQGQPIMDVVPVTCYLAEGGCGFGRNKIQPHDKCKELNVDRLKPSTHYRYVGFVKPDSKSSSILVLCQVPSKKVTK